MKPNDTNQATPKLGLTFKHELFVDEKMYPAKQVKKALNLFEAHEAVAEAAEDLNLAFAGIPNIDKSLVFKRLKDALSALKAKKGQV